LKKVNNAKDALSRSVADDFQNLISSLQPGANIGEHCCWIV